jgi:nitroimidazol reductase NimA-like FMN-containing flavoprotein (pyridoxamine 5'-phosphate oxidase superfamily)
MATPDVVENKIRQLLEEERLAVVSTDQGGQPYASLVAFAATTDLRTIAFCTPRTTRKFANLSCNPRVAVLINNSRNESSDIYRAVAVTAIGTATAADGPASEDIRRLYLEKHPHLKDFLQVASTAVVQVQVDRYLMVHHFQNVYDYRITS